MNTDFIIIGTGLAGLTSAITLSQYGSVLLVSKSKLSDTATNLAQGGIAAAVDSEDSIETHFNDTVIAGAGHNKKEAVKFLVLHGPSAVNWLERQGVVFDRSDGKLQLGQEGAHSFRRVHHASDFTGKNITETLLKKVKSIKNITILENTFFLDLLVRSNHCYGVSLIKDQQVIQCFSKAAILATGGLGQIYLHTTNPYVATGDGVAAGYRAGARVSDMEFIQFHPTALITEGITTPVSPSTSSGSQAGSSPRSSAPLFLLSEAIRGEGAFLLNEKGQRFMESLHPLKELAPRDILSRAIFQEQKNGKVYLDIRHKGIEFLLKRFPNTFAYLLKLGLDMSQDLLPVTPAAHYSCGGLTVDLYGQTEISGLFAFGETSCTGAQGANRLASNSLLEAVVFPLHLAEIVENMPKTIEDPAFPAPQYSAHINYPHIKHDLQKLMWEKVGIIRSKQSLFEAKKQLAEWEHALIQEKNVNESFVELKNMVTTALLVTEMALLRTESLGTHYVI